MHLFENSFLSQPISALPIAFFDLETTGGNPHNSRIIEVGIVSYKEKEKQQLQSLINPKCAIPPIVQRITGIKDKDLKNAPSIESFFPKMLPLIEQHVIIAHGALCDVQFLEDLYKRIQGKEFSNPFICTHLLSSKIFPKAFSKSLSGMVSFFGGTSSNAHSALGDATMTEFVFWKLYEELQKQGYKTLEDILRLQGDRKTSFKLKPKIDPLELKNTPKRPGVLLFKDKEEKPLFCYASHNTKHTLHELFLQKKNNKTLSKLINQTYFFETKKTDSLLEALKIEQLFLSKTPQDFYPEKILPRIPFFIQLLIPRECLQDNEIITPTAPFSRKYLFHFGRLKSGVGTYYGPYPLQEGKLLQKELNEKWSLSSEPLVQPDTGVKNLKKCLISLGLLPSFSFLGWKHYSKARKISLIPPPSDTFISNKKDSISVSQGILGEKNAPCFLCFLPEIIHNIESFFILQSKGLLKKVDTQKIKCKAN